MDTRNLPVEEMERYVTRFSNLHGSGEAYIDSRLPGHRRHKINLVGMGVVEAADIPDCSPIFRCPRMVSISV